MIDILFYCNNHLSMRTKEKIEIVAIGENYYHHKTTLKRICICSLIWFIGKVFAFLCFN